MSEPIDETENLVIEPVTQQDVLEVTPALREFFRRRQVPLSEGARYVFQPSHKANFEGSVLFDAKNNKLAPDDGYTIVDGTVVIEYELVFPAEFAYTVADAVPAFDPYSILKQPFPGQHQLNGWTRPFPSGTGTVYYATNGVNYIASDTMDSWTVTSTNGQPGDVVMNYANALNSSATAAPRTIADFEALRASGYLITVSGTSVQ